MSLDFVASSILILLAGATSSTAVAGHVDHVILAAPDLTAAMAAFEKATGVRPVYGGKHPRGTHNALVALDADVYLEILALQPGATPTADLAELGKVAPLTPYGWAVRSSTVAALQRALAAAGFASTPPQAGSRVTPDGKTLRWQTLALATEVPEAPFFIVWEPGIAHPSTTSPRGCTLRRLVVAGTHDAEMRRLRDALGLTVDVQHAAAPALALTLTCPRGEVTFGPRAATR